MKIVEVGDIFEYEQSDGPDEEYPTYTVYRLVQQILNSKYDVAAGRVILQNDEWLLTPLNSGTCINKMIGDIVTHVDATKIRTVDK